MGEELCTALRELKGSYLLVELLLCTQLRKASNSVVNCLLEYAVEVSALVWRLSGHATDVTKNLSPFWPWYGKGGCRPISVESIHSSKWTLSYPTSLAESNIVVRYHL